jgi:SAM-dependent methyltransferase
MHPVARAGFGGGAAVEAYEAARPSYPAPALADCVARAGLGPGARVLDLAAGTGKLTRQLLDLRFGDFDRGVDRGRQAPSGPPQAGPLLAVEAAEPNPGMRAALERACPGARAAAAAAEALPYPDGAFDAVLAGQAFHCACPAQGFGQRLLGSALVSSGPPQRARRALLLLGDNAPKRQPRGCTEHAHQTKITQGLPTAPRALKSTAS